MAISEELTYEQKVAMVLEDYWAGKIGQIRANEMLENLKNQYKIGEDYWHGNSDEN
jgi:hypothetical protein